MRNRFKTGFRISLFLALFLCLSDEINAQASYDKTKLAAYFQKQDFEEAIRFLKLYESGLEGSAPFYTDMGYALFMNEQYDESKAYFQKALSARPGNFESTLYLAQIWSIRNNRDSSLFYYNALTISNPDNYRFWQKAGNLNYQLSQYDSAFINYQQAYKLNNRSGRIAVSLANLYIRNKKIDVADSLLQEFLMRDSTDEDVIAKRMEISFKKSAYDTVIRWGEKLWSDSSQLAAPFVNLAFSYLNKQLYPQCLQLCEWLEYANKANESIIYCEALAFSKTGRYKESNEKLDECLKMSIPEEAHTYLGAKADNYESMKDFKKAVNYYDTAWYIFHKPFDLYFAGRIYDKYYQNKTKAGNYYGTFQKNKPAPKNGGEVRVIEYIEGYLQDAKKAKQKQ